MTYSDDILDAIRYSAGTMVGNNYYQSMLQDHYNYEMKTFAQALLPEKKYPPLPTNRKGQVQFGSARLALSSEEIKIRHRLSDLNRESILKELF